MTTDPCLIEFIGKPSKRVDAQDKVTGAALYAADIQRPGMLIGRCLRSPYASAQILSIDVSKARALPGVHAVLTGEDVPNRLYGRAIRDVPILAKGQVRFVGEKVAAVAADSVEVADAALELIVVNYKELPSVVDVNEAFKPDSVKVHNRPPCLPANAAARVHGKLVDHPENFNIVTHLLTEHGDIEVAFAAAHRVFEHQFTIPSVHQGYLEPHACLVEIAADGIINVWIANKSPHVTRLQLAEAIGVSIDKLIVHPVVIGGDFGGKGSLMDAPVCYYLSRSAGRPVKMVMSYFEELTAGNPRHAATITLQTALDRDARIVGIKSKMLFDTGAYGGFTPVISLHGAETFAGAYHIPSLLLDVIRVHTNTVPAGHMRGPGGTAITFALESHFDIIAHELQVDPFRFRRMNAISEGDLSPIGQKRRYIHCGATIDAAIARLQSRKSVGGSVGRGIALYEYPPGTFDTSWVELRFNPSGSVEAMVGAPDTGTGFHTIVAELISDHFCIPINKVEVRHLDTVSSGYEKGASASRLTNTISQAIADATRKAKERMLEIVAHHTGEEANDLAAGGWPLVLKGKVVQLDEILKLAALNGENGIIQAGVSVSRPTSDVTCFATQIAEVDVDRDTGQVRVLSVITSHDVGRVLNEVTHQGQIEGGLIQGLGQSMSEVLRRQDGAIVSASLGDYKLPCIKDIPELETVLVKSTQDDSEMIKSIGEISNAAIIAAIANAVYDAVGVRLMELPISAEQIHHALKSRDSE